MIEKIMIVMICSNCEYESYTSTKQIRNYFNNVFDHITCAYCESVINEDEFIHEYFDCDYENCTCEYKYNNDSKESVG